MSLPQSTSADDHAPSPESTHWLAIAVTTFCVSLIVGTELLPVGLLTVMANDLGVSKGAAGQSISATALVAVFSGLFITRVIGNWDRKYVSIAFSCLLLVASVLVAVAPNYQTMIAGRLLLGVPLGGFWAISAAFVMRLARKDQMSTALSIVLSGISVAMVVAAPLGSLLEPYIGWRGVFGAAAVGGLICALLQAWTLPRMPEHLQAAKAGILGLLKRPGTISAMLAMFLVFSGHIAFFTYMRPFYEEVVGIKGSQFAALLLGFCVANFAGTVASSAILRRSLVRALAGAPLVMGVCVALLCTLDLDRSVAIVITLIWGMAFGLVPVGWSNWVAVTFGKDAELAGGLQVASIQLANAAGAGMGGLMLNLAGPRAPLYAATTLLLITVAIVNLAVAPSLKPRQVPTI